MLALFTQDIIMGILVCTAMEIIVQIFKHDKKMNKEQEYKLYHFENEGSYKTDIKRINSLL